MLKVKNLHIKIEDKDIVNNINFEIKEGEILGIAGESGSGKSMICRSILGLNKFNNRSIEEKGEISFFGENLLLIPEKEFQSIRGKRISIIFQNTLSSLNPLQKIGKQIAEIFNIHTNFTKKEIKSKVIELLKDVQIINPERIYNMYPHELSGGMAQRIVISIAIALKPKLIIADEPTTSLDEETADEILNLLINLAKKNDAAIIFVSHDLNIIRKIADGILLIKNGKKIEYKSTKDFFENPESEYGRDLIKCTNLEKINDRFFKVGENYAENCKS